jgi:hypothetical protein
MARIPNIEDLSGLWRRSLIAWPDGRRDVTTWVRWLQGSTRYIDLRQPANRPDFSRVGCLRALDGEGVKWLAGQEGFAGTFVFDGTWFEWRREIDFQPKALYSDAGALRWDGDVLVEEGRDVAYIEHWHRDEVPGAPMAAVTLASDDGQAALLRVGDLFMYARARPIVLPEGRHLEEHVAGASSLAAAQDLVDCEISIGRVDGWVVDRSSLPWREGATLAPWRDGDRIGLADVDGHGRALRRSWRIVSAEGDPGVLSI